MTATSASVCVCAAQLNRYAANSYGMSVRVGACVCVPECGGIMYTFQFSHQQRVDVYGMPQPIRKVYYAISVDGLRRERARASERAHMRYARDMKRTKFVCGYAKCKSGKESGMERFEV